MKNLIIVGHPNTESFCYDGIFKTVKNELSTNKEEENEDIFSDINYICKSTPLIVSSLQKGLDVAQLPNGDVLITEVRVVNTQYSWDKDKQKLTKVSQN